MKIIRSYKYTYRLLLLAFVFVVSTLIFANPARALTNNSSYLPFAVYNLNNFTRANCDRNWAQFTWISDATDTTGLNSFTVSSGVDQKSLLLNNTSIACDQNISNGDIVDNSLQKTNFIFDGPLTAYTTVNGARVNFSTAGLSQNLVSTVVMDCTNFWNLRYGKQCIGTGLETAEPNRLPVGTPISIGGLSQLGPGNYIITMQYDYYAFNNYTSNAKCVGFNEAILTSIFNLRTSCGRTTMTFYVAVTIPAPPVPDAGTLQTYKYSISSNNQYSDRFTSTSVTYGSQVPSGTKLISSNGGFEAIWDENNEGQLKVYDLMGGGRVLQQTWGPKSTSTITNKLCLQDDGNLVIRANVCSSSGTPFWDSGNYTSNSYWKWQRSSTPYTAYGSSTIYYLKMQDDGNLTVYNTANSWLQTSNTLRIGGLDHSPSASTSQAVANASVSYLDANGTVFFTSTGNPAYRAGVYVTSAPFTARITVPKGFDYASSFIMDHNGGRTKATPNATCTANADGTDTCNIPNIYIDKNVKTTIDFVMKPEPPLGYLDSVCSAPSYLTQARGWAYDPQLPQVFADKNITPSNIVVKFDEGTATEGLVSGIADSYRPGINAVYSYVGDYHGFMLDVPEQYFDGQNHTAKAYVDRYNDGNLIQLRRAGDTTYNPVTFNCGKHFFPWLQTKQGDVVADGKVTGQKTSTNGVQFPGARLNSSPSKEAEFLIISAVGSSKNEFFCSTYNYVLTNTQALNGLCKNGTGYNFNSTNIIGSGDVDRVIAGVKQAFADNGNNTTSIPSACSANGISTATFPQTPEVMTTNCTGGIIYKQSSNTLPPLMNLNKGKVTIFVDGDLTITGPILYTVRTDLYPVTDPRLVPTLAIVVNGNVDITSNTTQIDAQIYANGTIRTCSKNSTNTAAASIQDCSANKLLVNGSLNSKGGFDFRRTFIDEINRTSAELIKLTGTSIVIPPPGIESRYFFNDFSGYKLDTSEYAPRF